MPRLLRMLLMSATGLTLGSAIFVGALQQDRSVPPPSGRPQPMLVYVGAEDCAPCRTWQRGAGATFRSSAEFAHLIYREVKSPTLLDVLNDEHWPEDLRGYRDRLGRGAGVPLWLVIADGEIIELGFGPSQWQTAVLPRLKLLLR
jgi:hypothetical protein